MRILIFEAVFRFVKWSNKVIRRGRLPILISGALAGGILGATLGLCFWPWYLIGFMGGAWLGASLFAAAYPRPMEPPLPPTEVPFSTGATINTWTFELDNVHGILVLLEQALFLAKDKDAPWQDVQRDLEDGIRPSVADGELIPLNKLLYFTTDRDMGEGALGLHYLSGSQEFSALFFFQSGREIEYFLQLLSRQTSAPLERIQRPNGFFASTWAPLCISVLLCLLAFGGPFLSEYWIDHPPPPFPQTGKRDGLVSALMWLEPRGTFLLFFSLMLPPIGWLIFRTAYPTTHTIISCCNQEESNCALKDAITTKLH